MTFVRSTLDLALSHVRSGAACQNSLTLARTLLTARAPGGSPRVAAELTSGRSAQRVPSDECAKTSALVPP